MFNVIGNIAPSRSTQWVRQRILGEHWNWRQVFGAGVSGICVLGIFFSSFVVSGTRAPTGELDPSWQAVLEFAWQKHMQFGSEIIFSYGPLGFLFQAHGFGASPLLRFAFAVAFSGMVGFASLHCAVRIRGAAKLLLLLWLLLFPNPSLPGTELVFVYLIAIFVGFELLDTGDKGVWGKRVLIVYLCTLALIKFSFLVPIMLLLAICIVDQILRQDWKRASELVICSTVSIVVLWLLLGQTLEGIFRYLWASYQIGSGYSEAMSVVAKPRVLKYALAAGGLFLSALVVTLGLAQQKRDAIAPAIIVIIFSLTAWKQGFVRADSHVLMFLFFLPVAYGFLFHPAFGSATSVAIRRGLLLGYFAAATLCLMAANAKFPGLPLAQTKSLGERLLVNSRSFIAFQATAHSLFATTQKNERPEDRLPNIAQLVGETSIDVFNYRQAVALLNGLNYRARPVFQSYSAYTPALQEANLTFYRSDRRPHYVLFALETIDDRFPTLDDAPTIPYLLNNYRPVLAERNFLLMEIRPGNAHNLRYEPVRQTTLNLGQKLDLRAWNNFPLFLRINAVPTILSRVMNLLYKNPAYNLSVELEGGAKKSFRFVPGMAGYGFLVNPLLENNEDVINLLTGDNPKKVTSVAIIPASRIAALETPITVEIYQSPNFLAAQRSDGSLRQAAAKLKYPMFTISPIFVKAAVPVQPVTLDGSLGLMVHAPGVMAFDVPLGAKQISGSFGLLEGAYTGGGASDGVEFIVEVKNRDGETRQGFKKLLQPKSIPSDRGTMAFSVPLKTQDQEIFLRTTVGPHMDGAYDWSAWSQIEIN